MAAQSLSASVSSDSAAPRVQNLFVMRHGERLDDADPSWVLKASRPWDPPLTERGKLQALAVGQRLRKEGWQISRILCSPFLRCVQTAAEVIKGLSEEGETAPLKPKVSLEYGLGEVMNSIAIRNPPRSHATASWLLEVSELLSMLPADTIDASAESMWPKLPAWQESIENAHFRYAKTFQEAADKFPEDNVLCVTHGEGVGLSVSQLQKEIVYAVNYCAYSHSQRPILEYSPGGKLRAGKFELLTESGSSGVLFGRPGKQHK
ncbi:hypothetical protein O6H91_11G105500 [Diphasiastrum complanatum]|uniref:Uncharacterized protein n=1 Tax=Diphasiastrum complanatum TaxID=34168 RepID=A0ACC2CCU0_DIPCM|nr:hypothetical protein O6H91_11G105500 [Diphasiastrum complanatum]